MSVSRSHIHHLGVNLPENGKNVHRIDLTEEDRGPVRSKEVLEVVTEDGSRYRWSRLTDSDPLTFEHRIRPDGDKDSATRPLPQQVRTFIDSVEETIIYR